jgi:S-adenosylmethionine:tRNA ribosyltransferase-isomerase
MSALRLGLERELLNVLDFSLPPELEASEPPEARGQRRDEVRLMVSYRETDTLHHAQFSEIAHYLAEGDMLVINTSGTMKASLPATYPDGRAMRLHLSTRLADGRWVVELRRLGENKTEAFFEGVAGSVIDLPAGARAELLAPYAETADGVRLWLAELDLPADLLTYTQQFGAPIRYNYVQEAWPAEYYQTVYATEMGSAEMPSAGRAFSPEVITRLVATGVQIVPLILHTGVASLENHEPPYEEYYRVPVESAYRMNQARARGQRVIAVGTTVVRALESVTDERGVVHPGEGWTDLVITPSRGVRAVDGLLTGFHEPQATHLAMLAAIAPRHHLELAYQAALAEGYRWHEFGDLHLIL